MAKKKESTAIPAASKLKGRGNYAVDCKDWRVGPMEEIGGASVLTGLSKMEAQRIAKEKNWQWCGSCHMVRLSPDGVCWKCRVPIAAECPV